jgi:hypothetical protein
MLIKNTVIWNLTLFIVFSGCGFLNPAGKIIKQTLLLKAVQRHSEQNPRPQPEWATRASVVCRQVSFKIHLKEPAAFCALGAKGAAHKGLQKKSASVMATRRRLTPHYWGVCDMTIIVWPPPSTPTTPLLQIFCMHSSSAHRENERTEERKMGSTHFALALTLTSFAVDYTSAHLCSGGRTPWWADGECKHKIPAAFPLAITANNIPSRAASRRPLYDTSRTPRLEN